MTRLFVFCILVIYVSAEVNAIRDKRHDIHWLMTENELQHYFGVATATEVTSYQLVHVRKSITKNANPTSKRSEVEHGNLHYQIKSDETEYTLNLKPNSYLLSPHAKILKRDGNHTEEIPRPDADCHFLHHSEGLLAAVSHCGEELRGYILDAGKPFEIQSLNPRLRHAVSKHDSFTPFFQESSEFHSFGLHILKAIHNIPDFTFDSDARVVPEAERAVSDKEATQEVEKRGHPFMWFHKRRVGGAGPAALTLELGVFVDAAAYKTFSTLFKNDLTKLRDLILAYVNGMQAIYYQPSLGKSVNLAITRMELFASQPADLNAAGGERGALLDNFCNWNMAKNNHDDSSPDHWDMGLYVSALDFYAMEGGKPNYITMGLAGVGGVCSKQYSCVIGELGTIASSGRPYPSTGFTAIYVMAHEIGHNLGMFHDSSSNNCPMDGFIMSPSRGVRGEATWSTCSADYLNKFTGTCLNDSPFPAVPVNDHSARYRELPGKDPFWSLNMQCQVFLQDSSAFFADVNRDTICFSIKCRSPNRDGYYLAGPALEGTPCTTGVCQKGECVSMARSNSLVIEGGWSDWSSGSCKSSCIDNSKGTILSTRACDNPVPENTVIGCDGPATKVEMCDDSEHCTVRMPASQFATEKCKEFAQDSSLINRDGPGSQQPHIPDRPWQACSIFCTRQDNGLWYTPRLELNDKGISASFPDGTLCHNDGEEDYFCVQRLCVSKSASLTRRAESLHDDFDTLNNALDESGTHLLHPSHKSQDFFSVDKNGSPISDEAHEMVHGPEHFKGDDYIVLNDI